MGNRSEYVEFNRLVKESKIEPAKRQEAWDIFKARGYEEARDFVQAIIDARAFANEQLELRSAPLPYRVWGREFIDEGSFAQMNGAMRLPVSVAGALMPDAHLGYGLPIGGVLATENAVIPYAVGVDIACRMMMTIYPESPDVLNKPGEAEFRHLRTALVDNTVFGSGGDGLHSGHIEHPLLDPQHWQATDLLRSLRQTAIYQIGTSGTGNHFVEWGVATIADEDNPLGLKPGKYLALLSHSGSRGVGYKIADHYSRLAKAQMPNLNESVRHLAWLLLDREAGQEYWHAMSLAGAFASANHHVIHERVGRAAGLAPIASIENHHNFAWREKVIIDGVEQETIVHRKGATPAGRGVLGVIPGTMADKGYIVMGKGEPESLESASHGGGRMMSRTAAKKNITPEEQTRYLKAHGVTLIGGGLDEAPQAYKQIESVMSAQSDLVDIVGTFQPRLVRMAADTSHHKRKAVPKGVIDAEGD